MHGLTFMLLCGYLGSASGFECTYAQNGLRVGELFMCCYGNLNFAPKNRDAICCHSKVYTPSSQMCCGKKPSGNNVYPKTSVNTACCNGEPYQRGEMQCCGEQLIKVKEAACCRNVKYVLKYEKCCDGQTFPIITQGVANPDDWACCKKKVIKKSEYICCSEKQFWRMGIGEYANCCADSVYDSRTHSCCGKTIMPKEDGVDSCCRGRLIDSKRIICCGGRPMRRDYGPYTDCCEENYRAKRATQIYDTRAQVCCGRELHTKTHNAPYGCCGKQEFNTLTHMCCALKVNRLNPLISERCCGQELYNKDKMACCAGKLLPLQWSVDDSYCCGNQLINIKRQICTKDNIIKNRGD